MEHFYLLVALFLFLNIMVGLWRVFAGPTAPDRMLAAQLFGTAGTAVLLLLAEAMDRPSCRDVALILVLLAIVAVAAFAQRTRNSASTEDQ